MRGNEGRAPYGWGMALDRRVTLRCLIDDLVHDWVDIHERRRVEQLHAVTQRFAQGDARDSEVGRVIRQLPRLNRLDHPLIRSFDSAFQDDADASRRQTISGTRDPHFWKVKTSRWRGAATDHSLVGSDVAWLCAGGIRADGDGRDFYAMHAAALAREPARFLPSHEDRQLARIDENVSQFDAWKVQVAFSTLLLFAEAQQLQRRSGPVTITDPSGDRQVARIWVEVESISDGEEVLVEVQLEMEEITREHAKIVQLATQLARASLNDVAEEWTLLPLGDDVTLYRALPSQATSQRAQALRERQEVSEVDLPETLRLGVRAHFAPREQLVSAQVNGLAVRALCGYWFVPTADHEHVPECDECRASHDSLPR